MKIADSSRTIIYGDRVILMNRNTGSWLKISKECFNILNEAIENKLTRTELLESFQDTEDREYFKRILVQLDALDFLKSTSDSRTLREISFSLTRRCNLQCTHCIVDAPNESTSEYLNTAEVIQILDKMIASNPNNITLTGGEPLLRKDFFEILAYLRMKFDGNITLMTNATLINKRNAGVLSKSIDTFCISIDGVDESSVSIVRGSGVYDKTVASIKLLRTLGHEKISLSMVLTENNHRLVGAFYELNKQLGTKPMLRALSLTGRAGQYRDLLTSFKEDRPSQLADDRDGVKENTISDSTGCSCTAGIDQITINYNGDVFPCDLFMDPQFKIGNINEIEDLNQFIRSQQDNGAAHSCVSPYEPDSHPLCKECPVNLFCWRCPHDLYRLESHSEAFKSRCQSIKPYLMKKIWEQEVI